MGLFVNQDYLDDQICEALYQREQEIANYEINRQNYVAMLDEISHLPDEYPAELVQYKGMNSDQLARDCPPEYFELASQLTHRDTIKHLLITNGVEKAKSELVYNSLLANLPEGERRDAAITRLQQKLGN